MSSSSRRTGRILPHQRDTDDAAPIIGAALDDIGDEYRERYVATLRLGMDDKTRKNYRSRIIRICKYWREKYPAYSAEGVRRISEEEANDVSKFYFGGHYKEDIVYTGLNVQYVLQFMLQNERKTNRKGEEKLKSHQDIRKYKDAIQWGAQVAGERLPRTFYEEMDKYLCAYKKKVVKARKVGELDEMAADPIPEALYERLLSWAVADGNMFVFFWTLCQWNCMARSASIDPLCLHNFSLGWDSIVGKYDDSKADKTADRLSEKNLYANHLEWKKCWWTGFAIWCCMQVENLSTNKWVFLSPGTKEGSAAGKYCEQVMSMIEEGSRKDEVISLMRLENFNPYGLRKGAATTAVSGTTAPPSIPSIAQRGEWSLGLVLDVYWHFSKVGDQYLGRILAGLDPNDVEFGTLPPHWTVANPMGHEQIREAMTKLYGPILDRYSNSPDDPTGLLLRCLAAFVYHVEDILDVMVAIPGHPFTRISILHERELLDVLKQMVTTNATPGILTKATGIPPHIHQAMSLQKVLQELTRLTIAFDSHKDEVVKAVENAIENKALESGHVTGTRLRAMLDDFHRENLQRLEDLKGEVMAHTGRGNRRRNEQRNVDGTGGGGWRHFSLHVRRSLYAGSKGFPVSKPKT